MGGVPSEYVLTGGSGGHMGDSPCEHTERQTDTT